MVLQWLVRFGTPVLAPDATAFAFMGGLLGAVAVLVWWVFLSRVPRFERWGGIALMIVAVAATPRILHAVDCRGNDGDDVRNSTSSRA